MIKKEKRHVSFKLCWTRAYFSFNSYTVCVLFSTLASLVVVYVGITSFSIGLKICAITAGIKKYKSVTKKKKKICDK